MGDEMDFQGALEDLIDCYQWDTQDRIGLRKPLKGDTHRTIQTALRLADRIQRGEISKKMHYEGVSNFDLPENVDCIYEAMITQLLKEIEDE